MRQRCINPQRDSFHRYGGRGISVCQRWDSFDLFFADMGPRPSSKHSIDRYPNNDGNYEPSNCRWATQIEQSLNRMSTRLTEDAVRQIRNMRTAGSKIREIAEAVGVPMGTVSNVIYGYSWCPGEQALPPRRGWEG
jgi:hypothetical protein